MHIVGSVGVLTVMVTFLGECPFPPLVEIRDTLSFMISWIWMSRLGLGVCFGMVGCLFILG